MVFFLCLSVEFERSIEQSAHIATKQKNQEKVYFYRDKHQLATSTHALTHQQRAVVHWCVQTQTTPPAAMTSSRCENIFSSSSTRTQANNKAQQRQTRYRAVSIAARQADAAARDASPLKYVMTMNDAIVWKLLKKKYSISRNLDASATRQSAQAEIASSVSAVVVRVA